MVGNLVDEPLPIAGSSPDPQLVAEQEELHTALLETINTLSPKNRSAILLFYHEQFSYNKVLKYFSRCSESRLHNLVIN